MLCLCTGNTELNFYMSHPQAMDTHTHTHVSKFNCSLVLIHQGEKHLVVSAGHCRSVVSLLLIFLFNLLSKFEDRNHTVWKWVLLVFYSSRVVGSIAAGGGGGPTHR